MKLKNWEDTADDRKQKECSESSLMKLLKRKATASFGIPGQFSQNIFSLLEIIRKNFLMIWQRRFLK